MQMHVFPWKFVFQPVNTLCGFLSFIFNVDFFFFPVAPQTTAAVEVEADHVFAHFKFPFGVFFFFLVQINISMNILPPIKEGRNLK